MTTKLIRRLSRLIPVALAAATVAAPPPPPAAPAAPTQTSVIHLAATATTSQPCAPPYVRYIGRWMDANGIPHTPMYFPEPIVDETRCNK